MVMNLCGIEFMLRQWKLKLMACVERIKTIKSNDVKICALEVLYTENEKY